MCHCCCCCLTEEYEWKTKVISREKAHTTLCCLVWFEDGDCFTWQDGDCFPSSGNCFYLIGSCISVYSAIQLNSNQFIALNVLWSIKLWCVSLKTTPLLKKNRFIANTWHVYTEVSEFMFWQIFVCLLHHQCFNGKSSGPYWLIISNEIYS